MVGEGGGVRPRVQVQHLLGPVVVEERGEQSVAGRGSVRRAHRLCGQEQGEIERAHRLRQRGEAVCVGLGRRGVGLDGPVGGGLLEDDGPGGRDQRERESGRQAGREPSGTPTRVAFPLCALACLVQVSVDPRLHAVRKPCSTAVRSGALCCRQSSAWASRTPR